MQKRGVSKKQFADALGKRPCEVAKWLSGQYSFTIATFSMLSTFFVHFLRAEDSKPKCKTLVKNYSFSSLFLGRGCLSGGGGLNRPQERTAAKVSTDKTKKGDRSLPEINYLCFVNEL